mmetsp:Transcript_56538/g.68041  ORF Transcript_56538/g.68041 Transcript_56538/m.68041 type:complete len:224 (+) Transcript_56538:375-1046(+)
MSPYRKRSFGSRDMSFSTKLAAFWSCENCCGYCTWCIRHRNSLSFRAFNVASSSKCAISSDKSSSRINSLLETCTDFSSSRLVGNGRLPAIITKVVTPRENQSALSSYPFLMGYETYRSCTCSGGLYPAVPQTVRRLTRNTPSHVLPIGRLRISLCDPSSSLSLSDVSAELLLCISLLFSLALGSLLLSVSVLLYECLLSMFLLALFACCSVSSAFPFTFEDR